jgi:toxin ParE1/3/4
MANRPRKSPQAEIDVTSIWRFIADDNVKAADTMLDRIEQAFDRWRGIRSPAGHEAIWP